MNPADYSIERLEKLSKSEIVRLLIDNSDNQTYAKVHQLFMEATFDASKDALFLVAGLEGKTIMDCNQTAVEIFGAEGTASVIGNDLLNFHKSPLSEKEIEEIRSVLAKKKVWETEYEYTTGSGREFWGRTNIREIDIDGTTYQLVRITDITKIKKVEKDRLKYALVAQKTDNAVIITDKHGNIEWVNDSFCRITEYEAEEVIGKRPGDLLQGPETDPESSRKIAMARKNKEKISIDLINYTKSGKKFWFLVDIQPIFDKKGQVERFISILTDITERKNTENELRLAKQSLEEALKEKDHFVSVVSHEIRTPLNAIIGIANLLDKDFSPSEKQENISTLKTSSHALLTLINDILDFSKIQSGKLRLEKTDFNISFISTQTHRLFNNQAKEKNINLEISIANEVPSFVKGDPTRLSQVLNNLVSNAIKFTDQGKVMLHVRAGSYKGEDQIPLIFEVKDTGIGIDADQLKDIFEPFRQANETINRQYGGTGLGLAIVKNLVEKMGGAIEVESVENKGTTFRVYLAYERGKEVHEDKQQEEKISLSPLNILYIEDVVTNQLLMKRLCSLWDVKISVASNGNEGLEKVKSREYDIILIDLRMPGMDGFEISGKIRALEDNYFKQVPIIAVTAASLDDNLSLRRQVGIDDAMSKPVLQEKLYKMLTKYAGAVKSSSSKNRANKTSEDQKKKIFDQLDVIFQKDAKGYKKTLLSIRKEFYNYKEKMKTGILERNDKEVSDIRHKIAGTSFILEHKSFYTFLKSLNNLDEISDEKLKSIVQEVEMGFGELIEEFDKKIRSFPF